MREFFISQKMAKLLLILTAGAITVLSVACVIFDKVDEETQTLQIVELDRLSLSVIASKIQEINLLLKGQNRVFGEINNSMTGILGIAKGSLEISPSLKPKINNYPSKPRMPRTAQTDSLEHVTSADTNDSIVIFINNRDSITSTPLDEAKPNSSTAKKCCCCN